MMRSMAPTVPAEIGSFEQFYRSHHEPMLRLAFLLTQSRAVAEDMVHDAFIRVQPRFASLESPAAYLRRAVTNACYSYHRHRRVEERAPIDPPTSVDAEHDEMWDALARLAPRRRAVLVLRYYADLSEAETAAALGCRQGTVKSMTHRAIEDLRKVLQP